MTLFLGDTVLMPVSKITLSTAMRARDVSRPHEEHLAAAADRENSVSRQPPEPAPPRPAQRPAPGPTPPSAPAAQSGRASGAQPVSAVPPVSAPPPRRRRRRGR